MNKATMTAQDLVDISRDLGITPTETLMIHQAGFTFKKEIPVSNPKSGGKIKKARVYLASRGILDNILEGTEHDITTEMVNLVKSLRSASISDEPLSYHDVVVYCGDSAYKLSDNYAYQLMCTRSGGWSLWYIWQGENKLIGEEFGKEPFCITIAGRPIVGSVPETLPR